LIQEGLVTSKLEPLGEASVVSLAIDTDAYFIGVKEAVNTLANIKGMKGAYVTSTRPARAITNKLLLDGVSLDNIFFIDSITYSVGGGTGGSDNVVFVESPAMLETLILKMAWFNRRFKDSKRFILLDSVNTLAVYNEANMLSEFIHILVNKLRIEEVFTVILTVGDNIPDQVDSMLRLVCDETINLRKGGV